MAIVKTQHNLNLNVGFYMKICKPPNPSTRAPDTDPLSFGPIWLKILSPSHVILFSINNVDPLKFE